MIMTDYVVKKDVGGRLITLQFDCWFTMHKVQCTRVAATASALDRKINPKSAIFDTVVLRLDRNVIRAWNRRNCC